MTGTNPWHVPGEATARRDGGTAARGGNAAGGRRRRRDRDGPEDRASGRPKAADDPESVAREVCLRLLTMGPRTRAELAEAVRKKGVPDEVAERILERFTEVGLIDDAAFAAAWVHSRHGSRGLAGRALAVELRRKGVADETVKEAVSVLGSDQEAQAARALVDRRLAATRGQELNKRTRRLVGMLARKGYGPGLAYRVVKEALADEGSDDLDNLPDALDD